MQNVPFFDCMLLVNLRDDAFGVITSFIATKQTVSFLLESMGSISRKHILLRVQFKADSIRINTVVTRKSVIVNIWG